MDTLSLLLEDISLSGAEFFECRAAAPWALEVNAADRAGFHIVVSGQAQLESDTDETLSLTAGDIVILPGGARHRLRDAQENCEIIDLATQQKKYPAQVMRFGGNGRQTRLISGHVKFNMELARPLIDALPPVLHLQSISDRPPTWLSIGLMFLAEEHAQSRPAQQAILNRLADIMFIECLRSYVDSLPESSGNWLLALKDPALSAVLSAMHRHPEKPWTATLLANIAHMSRSGFANRFTDVMGEPPLTYLTRHRMRLASWQLRHTRQPVCRIAEQVGYTSDTAFGQAFKRLNGCSPRQYREQHLFNLG